MMRSSRESRTRFKSKRRIARESKGPPVHPVHCHVSSSQSQPVPHYPQIVTVGHNGASRNKPKDVRILNWRKGVELDVNAMEPCAAVDPGRNATLPVFKSANKHHNVRGQFHDLHIAFYSRQSSSVVAGS